MRYLLDTCVLSEMIKSTPDANVIQWFEARKPHELCISAMTWGELQRGVARLPKSKRRSELTLWLEQLEAGFEDRILAFDQKASEVWAQMTVQAEEQGKSLAAFDSIIAATARACDCKLVTRNVRDFAHADIDVLNPWQDQ
ncbi:type II toxin-antitoxin system VapC family toxin [Azonexus sp.]|uniref:type II toxin-antitoxin system VapC family toxin n=1 Tax=Azonexus sp. TaxID=1872668 RepID=UPI0039E3C85E